MFLLLEVIWRKAGVEQSEAGKLAWLERQTIEAIIDFSPM